MYTAIANVYLLSGMFNVYSLDCCCFWSNKKHFVFSFAQTMLKSYTLCIHFRTILHIILTKCSQLIAIIINSKKMRMCVWVYVLLLNIFRWMSWWKIFFVCITTSYFSFYLFIRKKGVTRLGSDLIYKTYTNVVHVEREGIYSGYLFVTYCWHPLDCVHCVCDTNGNIEMIWTSFNK